MKNCPKCNTELSEATIFCTNCGFNLTDEHLPNSIQDKNQSNNIIPEQDEKLESKTISSRPITNILFFILAIVVLIISFVAANRISAAGSEISNIRSVGGKTLEEAYYQELGKIYSGFAIICRCLGLFFTSVLIRFGLK